jgi:hypothetical protein
LEESEQSDQAEPDFRIHEAPALSRGLIDLAQASAKEREQKPSGRRAAAAR